MFNFLLLTQFIRMGQLKLGYFQTFNCIKLAKGNLSKPMKWEPTEDLLIMNQSHP